MKLLQKIGVENIDTVTLMSDCNNPGYNLGYAFLELETNRDALMAYRKLSRKGIFGRSLNITVAWAETLSDPDPVEAVMQEVKSIFVEGIPTSWDQAKITEVFKKYGKFQRVVLSCDIRSSRRNDFAFVHYTTHEAAALCLESFDREQFTENGSKVNINVSQAKPVRKGKQNKEDKKISSHEKAPDASHDYCHIYSGKKRPFSTVGDDPSYPVRRNSCAPHESSSYPTATLRSGALPRTISGPSPYYHGGSSSSRHPADLYHGVTKPSFGTSVVRQLIYAN
ncbi:hypothetical protein ACP4OV_011674 [Aristida adscensionis]